MVALDECERARCIAQSGWPQAASFELHAGWADYLALLAALDVRLQAAARLAGYADTACIALDERRQENESAAVDRARTLARAALGEAEYDRLHAEGAKLRDADIAALAFGTS